MIKRVLLLFVFASSFIVNATELRTWTSMNGHTTDAVFIKVDRNRVFLQKTDGKVIDVDKEILCDDDWMYIAKFDPSILRVWLKLGECQAKDASWETIKKDEYDRPGRGYDDIGGMFRGNSVMAERIRRISASVSKPLEFFVSDDGILLVYFANSLVWQGPFDYSFFSAVNHPRLKSVWFHEKNFQSFQNHQLMWMVVRAMKSGGLMERDLDATPYLFLAINGHLTNSGGVSLWGKGISTFMFDEFSFKNVGEIAAAASSVQKQFASIPRYARLRERYEKQNAGIPKEAPNPEETREHGQLMQTGSGCFISTNGYFLTNYHVVRGGSNIYLLSRKGLIHATIVRVDSNLDIALLKTDEGTFDPIALADEGESSLGDDIFTIGFPMPDVQGFSPKLTKGVISSLSGLFDDPNLYQIDAAIQPGNSGGPLADDNGCLVGIIVSKLNDSYVSERKGIVAQNVNFAIKKGKIIPFLQSFPDCWNVLPPCPDEIVPFKTVVKRVENSCAMVITYEW